MDVNQKNSMGITALHGAANRGSDDIIRFLVAKGADLTAQDNEHRSALDWAKGVFLATHPPQPKPTSIALISQLLKSHGKRCADAAARCAHGTGTGTGTDADSAGGMGGAGRAAGARSLLHRLPQPGRVGRGLRSHHSRFRACLG